VAASPSIDVTTWLEQQLGQASPDLLRQMVKTFAEALMSAEADAVCGAGYGARDEARTNRRNGYRAREWDTRVGSIDLNIPKLRSGSCFPDWLLEPRRRAEQAMGSVVATSYLLGVSTRRMEKLVDTLGIRRLSKSQVSAMAASLDEQVAAFRTRPLDAGPYTFVAADALVVKVREAGRVVNVHLLLATGVNGEGYKEILGLQIASAEDKAGWLGFFRDLVARGLSGVALVTSDAHAGLVEAIGATLPGASWQRSSANITGGGRVPLVHLRRRERTLCSVTGQVQRQTCPSRRWRISTGQWESCLEHLDERPEGSATEWGRSRRRMRCQISSRGLRSRASTGVASSTSFVLSTQLGTA
jgi:transposase-like protein